ncbi:hypothetical protein KKA95_02755, partial [Patescibacteria group bacterium]|nr:hypothetical protein [Patescibacteria group bacterium]
EHNILMAKIWDNAEIRNKAGEFIEENLENYSSGDWFKLNKQFARIFGIKTNDMDEIGKYIKALQIEIGAEDDGCFGRDTMTALYPVFERKGYFERNLTNPVDIAASEYARWTNQRVSSDNKFFRKYFNKAYEELGAPEDFDGGMPTWAHAMTEKMYDLEDQARDSKEEVAVAQVVDEEAPEWETHDFSTGRTEMPNEEDVEVATGFTGSDADMDSDIDADADTDFDDRDKA